MKYIIALWLCIVVIFTLPIHTGLDSNSFKPTVKPRHRMVKPSRAKQPTKRIEATATAYDISVESCGKTDGITKSGFNLTGHKWDTARTIAVDPTVIPLGTVVFLNFRNDAVSQYSGVYVARDVGGDIKGHRIDVFIESRKKCFEFGRQKVTIEILGRL